MSHRILLTGGSLVDGTGAAAYEGDLLLEDGHIAEVGKTKLAPDEVVSCRGLVIAPGFIDMHSHGDFSLPWDPEAGSKVQQGVTTEVVGNCGLGLFPANDKVDAMYERLAPLLLGEAGATCSTTLSEYRNRLETQGISVNAACLTAHGNVRCAVMGLAERAPTASEIRAMQVLVERAMDEGAFGLSTGLVYAPGAYATEDEIVPLCEPVRARGGIYATHMRNEGARLVSAVEEAIRIGRAGRVPVQISHHKAAGRFNWGKVKTTLALIDEANRSGMDVNSDVYPYTAGSTVLSTMFLPLWAFEGSTEDTMRRLRDPETRQRIIDDAKEQLLAYVDVPKWLAFVPKKWVLSLIVQKLGDAVIINSMKHQHHYEGRTIGDIARERGRDLHHAMLDLLIEEETAIAAIAHVMCEADVTRVMQHPRTMIGTDGFLVREGKPHPRTFGTYPRVLEDYVAKRRVLSLEAAVHRMTGMPAAKLGLADRGVLAQGKQADVVVFSAGGVRDRATFEAPRRSPDGVPHVFVNGQWTVKDGVHTGRRAGRVLRHTGRPTPEAAKGKVTDARATLTL